MVGAQVRADPSAARPGQLGPFAAGYSFGLDRFQLDACAALEAGEGVLVCAPTGAGKTVVGEFAVHLALAQGRKCFYTTPIKALSNQKLAELSARFGERNVGLLTGDTSIRSDAPVVVMTTEVLRNMLYAGSPALAGLGYVVMDEVHYLADRFRGAVWEEVIIHLPDEVRLVSLSATVSNAEELAAWLVTVRGHTRVVLEEHRPVPLFQHVMAGTRLYDLFSGGALPGTGAERPEVNPQLTELAREDARGQVGLPQRGRGGRAAGAGRPRGRARTPDRASTVERLEREGLLPGIVFVFSRAGCDASVTACVHAGLRLLSEEERAEVRATVERRTRELPEADLVALGYWEWVAALERGVAAHHAGMLPAFKEVVEELFTRGLVKVVFATETLALGINMPARSVTLSSLSKWNGETHADITPGEYTQLTGRAGRRGIDVEGHAVVLWQPGFDPRHLAGLASTRTFPLRSSFRPSYNMAVNLVDSVGRDRARALLGSSFAQFQTDRAVVGLQRQLTRNVQALAGYAEAAHCELGDVVEYDRLRRAVDAREAELARRGAQHRRAEASDVLEALKPGDVLAIPGGRRAGVAVVLDAGVPAVSAHQAARGAPSDGPRPVVLTGDRQVRRLSLGDFPTIPQVLGRVRVPRGFNARSPQARRDLASTLHAQGFLDRGARPHRTRSAAADDGELARLRAALRAHPVHGCHERADHLRWGERTAQLERDTAALRRRVDSRTGTLTRTFDQVCAVLERLGHLVPVQDDDAVTPAGRVLARIYGEDDLVTAECLRRGLWDGLDPAALAAVASTLVYEPRRPDEAPRQPAPPTTREAVEATARVWGELAGLEAEAGLATLREPDQGFAWAAHRWARGGSLATVLDGAELTAGDFVRWVRQLIDLLDQVSGVAADTPVGRTAGRAVRLLRRGVVATGPARDGDAPDLLPAGPAGLGPAGLDDAAPTAGETRLT